MIEQAFPADEFESRCRQLVGWTIQKIIYTEADLTPVDPQRYYRTDNPHIHSVDFSVVLLSSDSQFVEIYWREFFHIYELSLQLNRKINYKGSQSWEATDEAMWKPFVGETIQEVTVYRATVETFSKAKSKEKVPYPQTLALLFSNGSTIWISAAEAGVRFETMHFGANNLLITIDEALKNQLLQFQEWDT